jgi:hypothetical protein
MSALQRSDKRTKLVGFPWSMTRRDGDICISLPSHNGEYQISPTNLYSTPFGVEYID